MKQGLQLLVTHFFYLSIVEVIQNERKANFVSLCDWNLPSKRACYVYNVGSINHSGINVKKCARRHRLKLQSANTTWSVRCNTTVQDRGGQLNQSHFRFMAKVSFLPSTNTRKRASANRELTDIKDHKSQRFLLQYYPSFLYTLDWWWPFISVQKVATRIAVVLS